MAGNSHVQRRVPPLSISLGATVESCNSAFVEFAQLRATWLLGCNDEIESIDLEKGEQGRMVVVTSSNRERCRQAPVLPRP